MTKKLQVFISSTYKDLRDERQAAVEAVLLSRHIPAGMELFSAGDASQLEVIKEWIRESDVYMLILGARYGSLEPISNIGYTEIEYDLAVGLGKPHFAVVLSDPVMERKKTEGLVSAGDALQAERMKAFRTKVLSKSSVFCSDEKDIKIAVLQSINEISRRPGLQGWVRPNEQPAVAEVLARLEVLSAENAELRVASGRSSSAQLPGLAELTETLVVNIEYENKGYSNKYQKKIKLSWGDLFSRMGIKMLAPQNDDGLNHQLAREIGDLPCTKADSAVILNADWETIKAQFLALGFVKIEFHQTISKTMALFWSLTPFGQQMALALRVVPPAAKG